jgi:NADH-quinone oxidoreductase subunit G
MVSIEIDGKKVEARQGQMIIEAADEIGVKIPRFCYHKKLSIAANCRMCLVEVGNAPKPLPACATPVADGMKIFTTSQRAVDAQKAVMEFLLINHPLDCPICDQGGQCELQDVALEYGKSESRFVERKRVVKDKDIGPLISTEMTRCIHCTRCVRFGTEIAGVREMGATGRGEFMQIGTYIEKSVNSEMSGNVIDLCPVGALTSKPFRFHARAWELKARPSVSPHDCVGSHLYFHTIHQKVMRALPRDCESLNEVWLSDRDRFSYEGLNHPDRLENPMIKRNNQWEEVDWTTALNFAIDKLAQIEQSKGADQIGALASPNSTVEEFYLLQKLLRHKGSHHVDHRLRQQDFTFQEYMGLYPTLGISLADLEQQESILFIGSNIAKEQPIIHHRLRKAQLHGCHVYAINPWDVEVHFTLKDQYVGAKGDMLVPLMEVVKAAMTMADNAMLSALPSNLNTMLAGVTVSEQAKAIAQDLVKTQKKSILLGQLAWSHPQAGKIYWLSRILSHLINATWGEMSNGANSAGGWLAGFVPHRLPLGKTHDKGLDAQSMLSKQLSAYILLNCEPEYDCVNPKLAKQALTAADTVIVLSAYDNPHYREYADVLLPITPISEMTGTYVNGMGRWQRFEASVTPLGQSRPAWKVIRVLANIWQAHGFNYETIDEVVAELGQHRTKEMNGADNLIAMSYGLENKTQEIKDKLIRLAPIPLYSVDGVVRRSMPLQETQDAQISVKLHPEEMQKRRLTEGQMVWVSQDGERSSTQLPVESDLRIPLGAALVPSGIEATHTLGVPFGKIDLQTIS